MSGGVQDHALRGLRHGFAAAAAGSTSCENHKSSTLSIRLTVAERAKLEAAARGAPLGRHIKDVVFRDKRKGYGIADRQALARVLRALADSNLALDLDAVYRASVTGEIGLHDAMSATLQAACDDVAAIRRDLIKALGLRPE